MELLSIAWRASDGHTDSWGSAAKISGRINDCLNGVLGQFVCLGSHLQRRLGWWILDHQRDCLEGTHRLCYGRAGRTGVILSCEAGIEKCPPDGVHPEKCI